MEFNINHLTSKKKGPSGPLQVNNWALVCFTSKASIGVRIVALPVTLLMIIKTSL